MDISTGHVVLVSTPVCRLGVDSKGRWSEHSVPVISIGLGTSMAPCLERESRDFGHRQSFHKDV